MIIAIRTLQERTAVEEENRQIYQKLLKALAIAKLGSWEYDVKSNEARWTDELYGIYEIPKEGEVLNYKAYHDRLHPDDIQRNDTIATEAIANRCDFSFEERLLFPDGRTKFVLVNGYPMFDEEHNLIGIQGTTQDITARKRQEEEVQRFFNLAVDLFCISSREGYFLRISRSFSTTLGYNELESTTHILRTDLKIDTPIIAYSAHAMASERMKCKEAGMNEYISKPYTEENLISVLAKFKRPVTKKNKMAEDDFAAVIKALEQNISKTHADKIVGIFRDRLPNEISLLEQAIEGRDFKLMEERSHYQAGSMSSLHFKQGYQIAYAAERAAAEKNSEKAD